jgi:hypothetical protein
MSPSVLSAARLCRSKSFEVLAGIRQRRLWAGRAEPPTLKVFATPLDCLSINVDAVKFDAAMFTEKPPQRASAAASEIEHSPSLTKINSQATHVLLD